MEPPEMINAGELVLKRWEPEWAGELSAAVHESLAELQPWMPWATDDYGPAEARAYAEQSVENWARGTEFNYAVFTTVGELIGAIGLMTRMGPGILEIGYWTRTPYAGRGHMTAAVKALTRVAVTLPGIDRITIRHKPANGASAAVAAKAGFTETARDGDHVIRDFRP
ncbi:GNAT family N-acetyltransferase [Actinoplanes sp. NEAU-A12]|uniref:GNAT family N-acetyltransferase n=1 Tax=Actinoplanes sandaracinus TaxID=3045177 RepID=A0ABT6WT05_9ACTN|nr:GNAT family N-acetyltransferase [Actinoplanes sandaracinus]MDI6102786.1 GNAT family N-acetyltransferase [Actinoplanes sandaracinus]